MITLYQVNDIEKILKLHFDGMSTDDKPTETFDGFTITNGSEFIELDTGNLFKFDADSKSWKKQEKQISEGGSSIVIDKTLQNEGQAADAKAVGDALTNKADSSTLSSYVQTSVAESTYAKKDELANKADTSALESYVKTATAEETYAKQTDLSSKADASALANYVQTSTAEETYAKKSEIPSKGTAVADAGDSDVKDKLNALLVSLRTAGVIATE